MYEHIRLKTTINMRKANYDKFPSTKLTGMLVQGWDAVISVLKKRMDTKKCWQWIYILEYMKKKCWMLFQKNSPER